MPMQRQPSLAQSSREQVRSIAFALMLVALVTALIYATLHVLRIQYVTSLYLIPVLIASLRLGIAAAVCAAIAGVGAAAFFFYPPLYDFRVNNPDQLIDMALFVVVAVVTSQLSAAAREAKTREDAEHLRDALIGSVSHELRTPLASIVGSASILARSPLVAANKELLPLVQVLQKEAERLNGDIENLIDATRISSEGIRPHWSWVDPEDIVNGALSHKRPLLVDRNVDIEMADDLPLIFADPTMVQSALGQIIENAVKYSLPETAISISALVNAANVEIRVADRGAGLAEGEAQRIFERFYRSPRHAGTIAGSGLGLWIARALVEACDGKVRATSAGEGKGATVSILLPVRAQPASDEQADD
ncbi:MAG: DUF4118 domain-containing protein [Pseudolabrys sp.]